MTALARLWSLRDDHPAFVALSVLALASLCTYPLVDWWLRSAHVAPAFGFWDFGAYDAAVTHFLEGEDVYVRNDDGGFHGKYLYPPFVLLVFLPITVELSHHGAAVAWSVLSVGLLWYGLGAAVAALGYDFALGERLLLLWPLLGFQPLLLSLKLGQTAAFLSGGLCLAFVAMVAGDGAGRFGSVPSGLLTGAIGVAKLPYAPSGAHLLGDRWRFAGAVVAGLGVVTTSILVFGVETNLAYLDVLAWGIEEGGQTRSPALWGAPYYRPLYWLPWTLALRVGGVLAIAALALVARDGDRSVFALGVAAIPLLAPQTYTYYFVPALLAAVILVAGELRRGGYPSIPVVGLLLLQVHTYGLKFVVDVLPPLVGGEAALLGLFPMLQPGLWGNLLLVGLAAARAGQGLPIPSADVAEQVRAD